MFPVRDELRRRLARTRTEDGMTNLRDKGCGVRVVSDA